MNAWFSRGDAQCCLFLLSVTFRGKRIARRYVLNPTNSTLPINTESLLTLTLKLG